MNVTRPASPPHGTLVVRTPQNRQSLQRATNAGRAQRVAAGLYIVGATLPLAQSVAHHQFDILAEVVPGGVICGKSALAPNYKADGRIYIAAPDPARSTPLEVPGFTIVPVVGPGPLPGDIALPSGIFLSGDARALTENLYSSGRPAAFRAGPEPVEDRIDALMRSGGAGKILSVLNEVDVIAPHFDHKCVQATRDRLRPLVGTVTPGLVPASPRLAARLAGQPFDQHRIALLELVVDMLLNQSPRPLPASGDGSRWEWLPFYEAYFSNFIEGTEFGVEQARDIVMAGVIPANRPADAHDVTATYQLAVDPADRTLVPRSGEELVDILRARHRVLMAARPEKRPGAIKELPNFAGGYRFVEPEQVEGTLLRGFEVLAPLVAPLFRSLAMMALVTECHPFDDGNGRVARLTANAELSAAGQVRIVVPTIYRGDYLTGLSAMSNQSGAGEALLAVLDFAQRWTARVDWSTFDGANAILERTGAYTDPTVALTQGLRLRMP